jgi:hypothetical protein
MRRRSPVTLGQIFLEADQLRGKWRVQKLLVDGIHAVLIDEDQPSRRKTFSISALNDRALFTPVVDA